MITIAPVFIYRDSTNTWIPGGETFNRTEAAEQLGISRTTLWRYEHQIVEPANILDFYRYISAHPKKLDCYCLFVLSKAIMHFEGEGAYGRASLVMKEQRSLYSRRNFDEYVSQLINKNQPQRRTAA